MTKMELERRLFEPKEKNFRALNKKEVETFLRLSAEGRKRLFQYTDFEKVVEMLNERELRLSRATELNDLREFDQHPEKAKRTFVASFCRTVHENVAMWWLYAFHGKQEKKRIPVRICFDGKALRKALKGKYKARIVGRERRVSVQDPVWCDVIYQFSRGGKHGNKENPSQSAIIFDGQIANGTRCKAFMDAMGNFPAYAKDGCWAHEEETRLTIELAKNVDSKGIMRIAIPIAEALMDVTVYIGPGELAKEYVKAVEQRLRREGFTISGSKTKEGRVAVRTVKGKDDQGREFAYTQRIKLVDSLCEVRFGNGKRWRRT